MMSLSQVVRCCFFFLMKKLKLVVLENFEFKDLVQSRITFSSSSVGDETEAKLIRIKRSVRG